MQNNLQDTQLSPERWHFPATHRSIQPGDQHRTPQLHPGSLGAVLSSPSSGAPPGQLWSFWEGSKSNQTPIPSLHSQAPLKCCFSGIALLGREEAAGPTSPGAPCASKEALGTSFKGPALDSPAQGSETPGSAPRKAQPFLFLPIFFLFFFFLFFVVPPPSPLPNPCRPLTAGI